MAISTSLRREEGSKGKLQPFNMQVSSKQAGMHGLHAACGALPAMALACRRMHPVPTLQAAHWRATGLKMEPEQLVPKHLVAG